MIVKQKFLTQDGTKENIFFPVTDTNAVYDENGNRLTETLKNFTNITTTTYSTEKPIQIGTWIDGTPIWRVAFNKILTQNEKQDAITDKTIRVPIDTFINNLNYVQFYTNAVMYASINDDNCIIDDTYLIRESTSNGHFICDLSNQSNITYRIYGYVEFVTPASNIKK